MNEKHNCDELTTRTIEKKDLLYYTQYHHTAYSTSKILIFHGLFINVSIKVFEELSNQTSPVNSLQPKTS